MTTLEKRDFFERIVTLRDEYAWKYDSTLDRTFAVPLSVERFDTSALADDDIDFIEEIAR